MLGEYLSIRPSNVQWSKFSRLALYLSPRVITIEIQCVHMVQKTLTIHTLTLQPTQSDGSFSFEV